MKVVGPQTGEVPLGDRISSFRKSRAHVLSQEELALAIGTNQGHISRIESNRSHPHLQTLVMICDVLGLEQRERLDLLRLAGYHIDTPLPDRRAALALVARLKDQLDAYGYPASIADDGERTWYWNSGMPLVTGPFWGFATQAEFLRSGQGEIAVERLFERYNTHYESWRRRYQSADHLIQRQVGLFFRAWSARPGDPVLSAARLRMMKNPAFERYWMQVDKEGGIQFVEHAAYIIQTPPMHFHSWRTRPTIDERFWVCHFTPADEKTRAAIGQAG